jgi:hypothetical protein
MAKEFGIAQFYKQYVYTNPEILENGNSSGKHFDCRIQVPTNDTDGV